MSAATGWRPVPLSVTFDVDHGGRWTSLRSGEREWLWHHPDPEVQRRRRHVARGEPFVDAGGVEELIPTVRGTPDHGDAWSQPWTSTDSGSAAQVACDLVPEDGRPVTGVLSRRASESDGCLRLDYTVEARPDAHFVHAAHALLELSPQAHIEPLREPGAAVIVEDDARATERPVRWPSGLDRLGPDDGSATCVLLRGCSAVHVVDGRDRLSFSWSVDDAALRSLVLWRNLGGWPQPHPYRSIGVEPMVGAALDAGKARPDQLVRVPASGVFRWSLTVEASRMSG